MKLRMLIDKAGLYTLLSITEYRIPGTGTDWPIFNDLAWSMGTQSSYVRSGQVKAEQT